MIVGGNPSGARLGALTRPQKTIALALQICTHNGAAAPPHVYLARMIDDDRWADLLAAGVLEDRDGIVIETSTGEPVDPFAVLPDPELQDALRPTPHLVDFAI